MSAPSGNAASPSPCACTNISLMQLFHELKQKFPGVPDHVVSSTIELYCHDKQACETHLHREVKASLTHAYHASSSAAARQLNELKVNVPVKCRNQPIVKHEVVRTSAVKSVTCQGPQKAVISCNSAAEENEKKVNTDANQNVVETSNDNETSKCPSPITIINIDNCFAKYSAESPSDPELTNDNKKEVNRNHGKEELSIQKISSDTTQSESTNYKILKSNKIKCNLNERLEKGKEKKTIKKEPQTIEPAEEKPKRPNTLDFIKHNPDIAFKETLKQDNPEPCRSVSPAVSTHKDNQKDKEKPNTYRRECGYPLNLSVNVNFHMDLSRSYVDPWMEDYESPRAITSVNLTVCTPTSNMASPVRETRDDEGGFEGHVTVTVSPSTTRPPRRRAPPPPPPTQPPPTRLESPRPSRTAPEPPAGSNHGTIDRSLIERQKERLSRLATALAQEKSRVAQLSRETQILAAPPPSPTATQRLKNYVERLRDECNTLSKRLEMANNEPDDSDSFYRNIYTGQRPSAMWQCHMCTFRNHELLTKCEECEMPRILVGTSPSRNHDSGFGSFRDRNRRGIPHSTSHHEVNEMPHVIESTFPNVTQALRSQSLAP
ncbi:TGF-beta-activated kinase 1 and MAP3K7-binding protein 2 [Papilio xuthus]|uniref:TGF-beta-activated kinase 1 and MAP3K7-binding protein 2 n=1 Tax=Papilio xuthus TaxID=66420 RepID=A0A194Q483_PAPXU|nr:TGF-beta-activated kinase 1 and MAP3K7-binding protein 2 [Papilio xuthus]